jgi:SAM-dependent methyltransferase
MTYNLFAGVYNRWMAEDFCRRAFPAIERLFLPRLAGSGTPDRSEDSSPLRILDICCGSGQMARALGHRGFRVTGLDASDEMLRWARQNAPRAELILADACSFEQPPVFAGALSTFNSLAHIGNATELEAVFRNVHAALLPGAPFLFDLSTEEAYTSKWRGSFGLAAEDCAFVVQPSYDAARRVGRNQVTLFQAEKPSLDGTLANPERASNWHRSDFCIEQRCHEQSDLMLALNSAAFLHVEMYDAQRDLGMAGEWGRLFFLCC